MTDQPVYVIAEAGVNHNGRRDLAFALIDAAADAKADAVKFQTFVADKLASAKAPKAAYQMETTGGAETQLAMLRRLEMPLEWYPELRDHAHRRGIEFLSTAFDSESLFFLDRLGMPMFKVPSGELTNGPLMWQIAHIGRPLILSTGMATLAEVEQALAVITHARNADSEPLASNDVWQAWSRPEWRNDLAGNVVLLHCTSQYPTPFYQANLRAMDTLHSTFGLEVGYSDHSEGNLLPVAAVARGARMIEKHFTLDRTMEGPDHRASLEPAQLTQMVAEIRAVEEALGDSRKAPQLCEWDTRRAARQSVVAARDIAEGAIISRDDLATRRAGDGRAPNAIWDMIGTRAERAFAGGEVFKP